MSKKKMNQDFKHYTDHGVLGVFGVPTKGMSEDDVAFIAKAYRCLPTPPPPVHNCNWCGETCLLMDSGHHHVVTNSDRHGLIDAIVSGGYASTPGNGQGALDDCDTYQFSLCEFCLDHLFTQFKVPPQTGSYVGGGDESPFRPAAERVLNDDWRHDKDSFFAEAQRRAEKRAAAQVAGPVLEIDVLRAELDRLVSVLPKTVVERIQKERHKDMESAAHSAVSAAIAMINQLIIDQARKMAERANEA